MSFENLRNLQLSDARITRLVWEEGELTVRLTDWEDKEVEIQFENTEGVIASSPEGEDLCHVDFSSDIPTGLIVELDKNEEYSTVAFVSA